MGIGHFCKLYFSNILLLTGIVLILFTIDRKVIVIGATNRIESIDPALRRPGRFDREFLFSLPTLDERKQILRIHTKSWSPPLSGDLIDHLAARTVGFCGADIRFLCSEAALVSLQRRYPQIYTTHDKLLINPDDVIVLPEDFAVSLQKVTPASQRSGITYGYPLDSLLRSIYEKDVDDVFRCLSLMVSDGTQLSHAYSSSSKKPLFEMDACRYLKGVVIRGESGNGQRHVAAAVMQLLDSLPIFCVSLSSLYRDAHTSSVESALVTILEEARKSSPSLLYLPSFDDFWEQCDGHSKSILHTFLFQNTPSARCFVLATCDTTVTPLFDAHADFHLHDLRTLTADDRKVLFRDLLVSVRTVPSPPPIPLEKMEVLRKASPPPVRNNLFLGPSKAEEEEIRRDNEDFLRILRIRLRGILDEVCKDRQFSIFTKSLRDLFLRDDIPEDVSFSNLDLSQCPMTLIDLMDRVDSQVYETVEAFRGDLEEMVNGIKGFVEFCSTNGIVNAVKDQKGNPLRIVGRSLAMKDKIYSLLRSNISRKFELRCVEIQQRKSTPQPESVHSERARSHPDSASFSFSTTKSARLRGERPSFGFDPDLIDILDKPRRLKSRPAIPSDTTDATLAQPNPSPSSSNTNSFAVDCELSPIHDPSLSVDSAVCDASFGSISDCEIILDDERLKRMHNVIVEDLSHLNLESLLELQTHLNFIIKKYKTEKDRMKMLEEMENVVERVRYPREDMSESES